MAQSEIRSELVQFIRQYIPSVEHLEVLLLVSALPDRSWTVEGIDQVIQSSVPAVAERAQELCAQGFLVEQKHEDETARYQFQPRSEELRRLVAELATTYRERRVRVIEAIYAPPSPMDEFSRAFQFRKDK